LQGETTTGMSLMQMDEGLDTGPVAAVRTTPIGDDETAGELAARLGRLGADMVREDLPRALGGEPPLVPQDSSLATLAPPLQKKDGFVSWTRSAAQVHAHVRAMTPWPGAFTHAQGKLFKILSTRRSPFAARAAPPGTVLMADSTSVLVACGDGAIEIVRA